PTMVYAGATRGSRGRNGIYRTRDGGLTWRLVNPHFPPFGTSDLAINQTDHRVVYAAGSGDVGVMKTPDGGRSWRALDMGLVATASTSVATDPSNPNIVFATTGRKDGLYRTTDGGQTWERSSRGLERHPIRIAVAP